MSVITYASSLSIPFHYPRHSLCSLVMFWLGSFAVLDHARTRTGQTGLSLCSLWSTKFDRMTDNDLLIKLHKVDWLAMNKSYPAVATCRNVFKNVLTCTGQIIFGTRRFFNNLRNSNFSFRSPTVKMNTSPILILSTSPCVCIISIARIYILFQKWKSLT